MECAVQGHAGDDRRWRRSLAGRVAHRSRTALVVLLVVLLAALLPLQIGAASPTGALRIDSGRFTVLFYPADRSMAAAALEAAARRDAFPGLPPGMQRIVIQIAPDAAVFREWAGNETRRWAAAVAFVDQHRVVVQGGRPNADAGNPIQVLRHELAHIALHDAVGDAAPRWFSEGYASFAAGEDRDDGFLATNVALLFRTLPTLAGLDSMLVSANATEARAGYALALRAVSDLAVLDRERGLERLLAAMRERGSFDLATRRVFAMTTEQFERDWQRRTRWRFAFLAVGVDSAAGITLLLLCLLPLWRSRRRAQRLRLSAMRDHEARSDGAARSLALDAVLRSIAAGPGQPDADA
jgi:hypothetical protein